MNEPFNLHVVFEGEEQECKARFERYGYTHRIAVSIGDETVVLNRMKRAATAPLVRLRQ